jgi:response regulator RpfG family c-di-GMP phosphodiesterase
MMSYAEQEQFPQPWLKINSTGRNVLIVDDDPSNRKLLREILHAERYTTVEAEDGVEGLFALEREPIDIVVSDILMPNMDGYSLCTEVRRRPEFKNVFFILYTAIDFTSNDEKRGLELGANRFIGKRCSPRVILNTIEELIGDSKERRCVYLRRTKDFPPEMEMKKYSAIMIRQLEENSIALEQTRDALNNQIERLKAVCATDGRIRRKGSRIGSRTSRIDARKCGF